MQPADGLENFNRILITALLAYVNKYQSDWEECLPAMLYSYHNTVHSATGFTPHQLLFGWTPMDLRAPFGASDLNLSADCSSIDQWLKTRQDQFDKARISLEYARAAMLRAHKKGAVSYTYSVGDLVKVTTDHLTVRATTASFGTCINSSCNTTEPIIIGCKRCNDTQPNTRNTICKLIGFTRQIIDLQIEF
jgi:hypothetical protein